MVNCLGPARTVRSGAGERAACRISGPRASQPPAVHISVVPVDGHISWSIGHEVDLCQHPGSGTEWEGITGCHGACARSYQAQGCLQLLQGDPALKTFGHPRLEISKLELCHVFFGTPVTSSVLGPLTGAQ